ncbi:MAG: SWIM zinc finger family protein [Planctomycetota bacterium]
MHLPSRKFPCKHVLALMWMFVESPGGFASGTSPDWVTDWVGRRRKPTGEETEQKADSPAASPSKSLRKALDLDPETNASPEQDIRRAAQAEKRAEARRNGILEGLEDLEQWISDQLRLGLAGFLKDPADRCRRIAARMVDAKASALASRIDEMPSRLLELEGEERLDAAITELGKLVLLTREYRLRPEDPEVHRLVANSETREQLLSDPKARRYEGHWLVAGESVRTRRDGLVSQSTWLLECAPGPARFAQLLDYTPASAGKRASTALVGSRFAGELVFYPAQVPLRAVVATRQPAQGSIGDFPAADGSSHGDVLAPWSSALASTPWLLEHPLLLPEGRLHGTSEGKLWWRAAASDCALPIGNSLPSVAAGVELLRSVGIWDGFRLHLSFADTPLGPIAFEV